MATHSSFPYIHDTLQKKGSVHGPCRLLDFELEVGAFVGGAANPLGRCGGRLMTQVCEGTQEAHPTSFYPPWFVQAGP